MATELKTIHAKIKKHTIGHVSKKSIPAGFRDKFLSRARSEEQFIRKKAEMGGMTKDQVRFWSHFTKFRKMVNDKLDALYSKADKDERTKIERFEKKWGKQDYIYLYSSYYNSISPTAGLEAARKRAGGNTPLR